MLSGYRKMSFRRRIKSDSDVTDSEDEYKLIVLGSSGVGKTALCMAFVHGDSSKYWSPHVCNDATTTEGNLRPTKCYSYEAERGCHDYSKWEIVDGQVCHLHVVDAQLPEEDVAHDSIVGSLVENIDGIILVYSVTDKTTFVKVARIYSIVQRLQRHRGCPVVLVGGKMDMKEGRQLSTEKGRELAFELGSSFYEASSRLDHDLVTKVFHDVVRQARCVKMRLQQKSKKRSSVRKMFNRLSLKSKSYKNKL